MCTAGGVNKTVLSWKSGRPFTADVLHNLYICVMCFRTTLLQNLTTIGERFLRNVEESDHPLGVYRVVCEVSNKSYLNVQTFMISFSFYCHCILH